MKKKLKEIFRELENKPEGEKLALGITHDSKKVREGFIFVAIKGKNYDGHDFVYEAQEKNALLVVTERYIPNLKIPQITLPDTRLALAEISRIFYDDPSKHLTVVGITGTQGKTTTTFMIYHIFKRAGLNPTLISTVEYRIPNKILPSVFTTPEANLLNELMFETLKSGGKSIVMEVSSHSVKEKRIDGINFSYGVFTNLGRDHLDYHKTLRDYKASKKRFLKMVKKGVALNGDDPNYEYFRKGLKCEKILTYGTENADLIGKIVFHEPGRLVIKTEGILNLELNLKTSGTFNMYNALASIGIGLLMNIDKEVMKQALEEDFKPVKGRFEFLTKNLPFKVLIDYAHTPQAMESFFKAIMELKPKRVVTIFGAGGNRDKGKRPLMGRVADNYSQKIILTTDNPRFEDPRDIIKDIMRGVKNKDKVEIILDREEAIIKAIREANEGDYIILLGKGHENYQDIMGKKHYFDEREIVKKALREMGIENEGN